MHEKIDSLEARSTTPVDRFLLRTSPFRQFGYIGPSMIAFASVVPNSVRVGATFATQCFMMVEGFHFSKNPEFRSQFRGFVAGYSWHACSTWLVPSILVRSVLGSILKLTGSGSVLARTAASVTPLVAGPLIDWSTDWYFFRFLKVIPIGLPRYEM